jgi:hypothetical protein
MTDMTRFNIVARSRRAAIAALLTISVGSVACASTSNAPIANARRDPAQWTAVSCTSCVQAGVEVSVRNSINSKGKTGRHMATQIRNLNPHAVVLMLEVVPEQPRPADAALISEKWRIMLHPAGGPNDSSIVLLQAHELQDVAVHNVEKF